MKMAPTMGKDKVLLVNLSGRGDKDINTVARISWESRYEPYSTVFRQAQAAKRKALIPFFTAGDPDPKLTVPLMHALVERVRTSSSWACRFPTRWRTAR